MSKLFVVIYFSLIKRGKFMKNEELTQDSCQKTNICGGRRDFLVKASTIAGAVVLSLSGLNSVSAQKDDKKKDGDATNEDIVLKLDDASPLSKIGGMQTIDTKSAGKVIIVRSGEMSFAAFRAKCPHKGGPIKYDEKSKQLFCPWHDSRFNLADGKVISGPAKEGLTNYMTQTAMSLTVKVTPGK